MSEIDSFAAAIMGYHPIRCGKSLWIRLDSVGSADRTFHHSSPPNDGGGGARRRGTHDLHPPEKHSQLVHSSPVREMRLTLKRTALPPPLSPALSLSHSRTRTHHNFCSMPVKGVVMLCGCDHATRPDILP